MWTVPSGSRHTRGVAARVTGLSGVEVGPRLASPWPLAPGRWRRVVWYGTRRGARGCERGRDTGGRERRPFAHLGVYSIYRKVEEQTATPLVASAAFTDTPPRRGPKNDARATCNDSDTKEWRAPPLTTASPLLPTASGEQRRKEVTLSPPTKPHTPAPYHMVPWRVDRGPLAPWGFSAPTRVPQRAPSADEAGAQLPADFTSSTSSRPASKPAVWPCAPPPPLNGSVAVRAAPPQRRPLGASLPVEKPTPRSSWIWGESASCGIRAGILAGVTLGVIRGVSCSRGN